METTQQRIKKELYYRLMAYQAKVNEKEVKLFNFTDVVEHLLDEHERLTNE